jgi:hypothetical protein
MSAYGEYLEVMLPVDDLKGASRAIAAGRDSMAKLVSKAGGITTRLGRRPRTQRGF